MWIHIAWPDPGLPTLQSLGPPPSLLASLILPQCVRASPWEFGAEPRAHAFLCLFQLQSNSPLAGAGAAQLGGHRKLQV